MASLSTADSILASASACRSSELTCNGPGARLASTRARARTFAHPSLEELQSVGDTRDLLGRVGEAIGVADLHRVVFVPRSCRTRTQCTAASDRPI
jgi:hypothetical protein